MVTSDNPFPPELRTAAIVPRWSVVWTLNRDTVATHSYYVTLYSYQIARLIGWRQNLPRLMFLALTHDLDETVTGDIVSPVKRAIVDVERARAYISTAMEQRMPAIWDQIKMEAVNDDEAVAIIECADRLDALLFLIVEQRMGNRHVFNRCTDAYERFKTSWFKLPASKTLLEDLWHDTVAASVAEHRRFGSNGV